MSYFMTCYVRIRLKYFHNAVQLSLTCLKSGGILYKQENISLKRLERVMFFNTLYLGGFFHET